MPVEYQLTKKRIYGSWINNKKLCISDSEASVKASAGRDALLFEMKISSGNRMEVPSAYDNTHDYDNKHVYIRGCITTIEIGFE